MIKVGINGFGRIGREQDTGAENRRQSAGFMIRTGMKARFMAGIGDCRR